MMNFSTSCGVRSPRFTRASSTAVGDRPAQADEVEIGADLALSNYAA
jgi:hypothetical protein